MSLVSLLFPNHTFEKVKNSQNVWPSVSEHRISSQCPTSLWPGAQPQMWPAAPSLAPPLSSPSIVPSKRNTSKFYSELTMLNSFLSTNLPVSSSYNKPLGVASSAMLLPHSPHLSRTRPSFLTDVTHLPIFVPNATTLPSASAETDFL